MIKNKKAVLILIPAIIGIIIGLAIYFIMISTSKSAITGAAIGVKSIKLLQASHKAENILFYIEQSADIASKESIYNLAEKEIAKCGDFEGYNLLNTKEKKIDECFTNIEYSFQIILNNNLNNYLTLYSDYYKIPLNNYDFIIKTDNSKINIIGFANNNLDFEATKKEGTIFIEEKKEDKESTGKVDVNKEKFASEKEKVEKYNSLIEKYSTINNVDTNIIRAVIIQESGGNKDQKTGSALGLMQIIPKWHFETCRKYCGFKNEDDFFDSEKNICCGIKILKDYYEEGKKIEWDCCDNTICVTADYSSWASALRKYNTAKCEGADADYVETIFGYYELWSGKPFSEKVEIKSVSPNKLLGYSIKPNFKVELDFDLNIFDKIKEQAKELIEKCSKEKNITSCVQGNIIIFNKNSDIEWINIGGDVSQRIFTFNVNTHKVLFPFEKEVIIKFALYFPQST